MAYAVPVEGLVETVTPDPVVAVLGSGVLLTLPSVVGVVGPPLPSGESVVEGNVGVAPGCPARVVAVAPPAAVVGVLVVAVVSAPAAPTADVVLDEVDAVDVGSSSLPQPAKSVKPATSTRLRVRWNEGPSEQPKISQ